MKRKSPSFSLLCGGIVLASIALLALRDAGDPVVGKARETLAKGAFSGTLADEGQELEASTVAAPRALPATGNVPRAKAGTTALPQTEQQSLWLAFSEAQRTVQPLTAHEAAMERNRGVRYFAQNPGQKITARFLEGAVRIESGQGEPGWQADFTAPSLPAATAIMSSGTRVDYHRGAVTEWFENRPEGIEHGFVVREPLSKDSDLRITVKVEGLTARTDGDPGAVILADPAGQPRLSYDKLLAWDARGTALDARMELGPDGIDLVVAAAGARYPVTIDPLISSLEGKLRPEITGEGGATDAFGIAVAVSENTAVIGASLSDTPAGFLSGYAYVFTLSEGVWTQQARLSGLETNDNDRFGTAVAVEGDTAVVGSYLDDPRGSNSGSAYVFLREGSTWRQQAKLIPADGAGNDQFGSEVSVAGNSVLIGASSDDSAAGSAYVFFRSGGIWTQQAKLIASDRAASDYFGSSVSIDGDTAVVGARLDDDLGNGSGSAYVFRRDGTLWQQQAKLTAADGAVGDGFGQSASLAGETLLIGAYLDNESASDSGSAYIFTRSGPAWTQQAKLTAADGSQNAYFGISVSLENDTALIGASWETSQTGSAYVFARNGNSWLQQAKLTAGDRSGGSYFGTSVALAGNTAFVGAADSSTVGSTKAGSAYVFTRGGTTWNQTAKIAIPGDSAAGDRFGGSVSLQGNTAVIGAGGDNTAAGPDVGSAYVLIRKGSTWSHQARIAANDGTAQDAFGSSVSLDGETILAGAILDSVNQETYWTGSAYVFTRSGTTWTQQAKLIAGDLNSLDFFGCSVSLDGDLALIGSYWDRNRRGSAYIFARSGSTWTQQAKLIDPDGGSEDNFGGRVFLSGTTALIGATGADDRGNASGSAFVFTGTGGIWTQQANLSPSDSDAFDYFGSSLAMSGDIALVGASGGSGDSTFPGSAYIFQRSGTTWTQQARLTPADGAGGDSFGAAVSLDGNIAVIGAPGDDFTGRVNAGSSYVFQSNGTSWTQQTKIASSESGQSDQFGFAVSLSGSTVLIGALQDDGLTPAGNPAEDQGSVYVYTLMEPSTEIAVFIDILNQPLIAGGEAREVFRVSVSNNGPENATGLMITQSSVLPAGTRVTGSVASAGSFANGSWSLNLPARQTATLVLSLQAGADDLGPLPFSMGLTAVQPPDNTLANNSASVTLPVIGATATDLVLTGAPELDRQGGLLVSRVRISNHNDTAVPAFRLYVKNLPAGMTLHNAHGTGDDGLPYLLHNQPLAPGASIELTAEFFSTSRNAVFTPEFEIELLPVPQFVPAAGSTGIPVTRCIKLSNGDFLVEIESIPGTTYAVEYTDDMTTWKRASGTYTALSNRLQWIDNGPPKTEHHPLVTPTRLYRFVELEANR